MKAFVALLFLSGILCQSIKEICRACGDVVNEYCCRYHNSCCEFISPTGCPLPSSPEARKACAGDSLRCSSANDCLSPRRCCKSSECGGICLDAGSNLLH